MCIVYIARARLHARPQRSIEVRSARLDLRSFPERSQSFVRAVKADDRPIESAFSPCFFFSLAFSLSLSLSLSLARSLSRDPGPFARSRLTFDDSTGISDESPREAGGLRKKDRRSPSVPRCDLDVPSPRCPSAPFARVSLGATRDE